jgi:S-adenosylmethionine hydrolase
MKGALLAANPELRIIDISHGVPAQDTRAASWLLAGAWAYFPPGSVHVAVVDPGVGSERAILLAVDRGHAFLAPDNGLLGPLLSAEARVYELDVDRFALPEQSCTFHGRDVFAPAAAALAAGLEPARCGPPSTEWERAAWPTPAALEGGGLGVEVLHVDRFGNLITALPAGRLAGERWCVRVGDRVLPFVKTYADVGPGEGLALIGSCGTLEVSVRDGDAADALDARTGSIIRVERQAR